MTTRSCLDCGALIRRGSRCPTCERAHRLGWGWSATRAAWLTGHPCCAVCGAAATEVDHVVPRAWGGGDERNLQSLCRACHRAKTARQRRS
ncbi:MAG: HNH endonuclease [Candidatus Limnocylindrales bacterium]